MSRNTAAEPVLDTDEIQGDILPGLLKKNELLMFFRIDDATTFTAFVQGLPLTTTEQVLNQRATIAGLKKQGHPGLVPAPGLNVAFTFAGLTELGVAGLDDAPGIDAFKAGMAARSAQLGDPDPATWPILGPNHPVHGVFILTGSTRAEIDDTIALHLAPVGENGWTLLHEEVGVVRPDPVAGHEHFGYADGVSQPGVRGTTPTGDPVTETVDDSRPEQGSLGQDLLWPGEFVFGYAGQDGSAASFTKKGPRVLPPVEFMDRGAFLVFRRLAQRVPEFDHAVKQLAATTLGTEEAVSAELLGAQLVGRWKSGAPLVLAPQKDDLSLAEGTPQENNFEFGDDRAGVKCPWAAHVRKAYPRDDVRLVVDVPDTPAGEKQVAAAEAFTQTHRMMRRGIAFGPELTHEEAKSGHSSNTHQRGLLFKCYVTSIPDQFEFVQGAWIDNPDFTQPGSGIDPIIGQPDDAPTPFLGAAPFTEDVANKPELSVAHFVHMQGGEYFFAPSVTAIRGL